MFRRVSHQLFAPAVLCITIVMIIDGLLTFPMLIFQVIKKSSVLSSGLEEGRAYLNAGRV